MNRAWICSYLFELLITPWVQLQGRILWNASAAAIYRRGSINARLGNQLITVNDASIVFSCQCFCNFLAQFVGNFRADGVSGTQLQVVLAAHGNKLFTIGRGECSAREDGWNCENCSLLREESVQREKTAGIAKTVLGLHFVHWMMMLKLLCRR